MFLFDFVAALIFMGVHYSIKFVMLFGSTGIVVALACTTFALALVLRPRPKRRQWYGHYL